jgi:uncharacterized protein YciI
MEQFIYQFKGNNKPNLMTDLDIWTEEDNQIAEAHFSHLKEATRKGIVIIAGRDPSGVGPAIVIFESENEEKALTFMKSDPFISSGLFLADLHKFRVALQRE